jgi:serine/threonine-protein kinase RsbW
VGIQGATAAFALQLRLSATPESASVLRRRLSLWLDGLGALADEIFDVSLAVTEAFSNAIEHPREPAAGFVEVDGDFNARTVTVTVRDSGSWGARRRRAAGGYGFPLMRHLMDAVEVESGPAGTSITLQRHLGTLSD